MAAMAQMHNALRAEIRDLKVKIVDLETAEADNARLQNELSNIKTAFEEEKANQESDFLNRLAVVMRENNSRVADLETKLAEHKNLFEGAQDSKTTSSGAIKLENQCELTHMTARNGDAVDVLQNQLRAVQAMRDELTRKLEEASAELELKDRKLHLLGLDGSFGSSTRTFDQNLSSENLSLQQKLREAKEEIEQLKAGTNGQTVMATQIDRQQQRKVEILERENLRLQSALRKAEEERKKHDITVLQLERRNHDLKMNLQQMEIQGKDANGDTRASYGFTDDGDLEVECQRLESELRKTKNELNKANLKQQELSYELRKAITANVECSPEVDILQQQNQSLHLACKQLGGEVDKLKKQLLKSGERNTFLMAEISNVNKLLQTSEQDKQKVTQSESQIQMRFQSDCGVDPTQNRTKSIIQNEEQTLHSEEANAVNFNAELRQKEGRCVVQKADDKALEVLAQLREENRKLNLDVNQLQRKLDDERKLSRSLKTEIGQLRPDFTESRLVVRGGRESFSSPGPSKPHGQNQTANLTGNSSTRGSVKGIAAKFENGVFQTQPEENAAPRTSFDKKNSGASSDEVKHLMQDLETERKLVAELEEELTRQCEINSSLIKEVNELSLETKTKRIENEKLHKNSLQRNRKDQEEIAKLTLQITRLSEELTAASKEKSNLQSQHQVSKHKIDALQEQVNNSNNDLNRIHSRDKETIGRLQDKVQGLEKDLSNTLTLVEDLRDKLNSQSERTSSERHVDLQSAKKALEEKENKITQMELEKEQIVLSMKSLTGFRNQEIEKLQIELLELKTKNAEQSREMKLLRDELNQRKYILELPGNKDDGSNDDLKAENAELRQKLIEATSERQTVEAKLKQYLNDRGGGSTKSVQILRERNAALKFEVEKLTKKLSKLTGSDTMQVTRVMI